MENSLLLSFEINTDIFESNVINIILLVTLLFNVVGAALKEAMLERKTKILDEVQGAEASVSAAAERLREAEIQSKQTGIIVQQIENKTNKIRNQILMSNLNRAYSEMHRMEKAANLAIQYEIKKAARENQDSLLTAGLTNAYTFIINDLTYADCIELNTKRIAQIPATL